MQNFSDLCKNQSSSMKNNYSRKSQNETGKGGKRIGKSLPPKTTGFAKSKSAPTPKSTAGDQKFAAASKKRVYSKPKTVGIKNIPKKSNPTGEMRLNKYIANAGVCSRREADTYISAGMVSVNGVIITELGVKVLPTDEVRFDGTRLNPEKKVYLLLNKPKDFVTTTEDPHADKIVMDLIKDACPERIYPVGRLDRNTTGLLLFTNDGDLSKRLTHPSHTMKKVYQVSLDKPVTMDHLQQIADGIELEDGRIAADAISYISNEEKNEIGIEIHSGRNRIVRRIFEHFGYRVKKLDRVMYAGLTKKNLPRGKYRFLTEKEIQYLKMQ
jgi:23S rRNA pseudouridine2605 synthase